MYVLTNNKYMYKQCIIQRLIHIFNIILIIEQRASDQKNDTLR